MVYVCKATTWSNIIYSPQYGPKFVGRDYSFNAWKVEEVRGIPNCGSSENSALWILDWLERDNYFTNEVVGKV